MNNLKRWSAQGLFIVFALVVLSWTMSNNFDMLMRATGNDVMMSAFGVLLFEGGCLTWMWYFLHAARGTAQRGASLAGSFLDLLLIVASVGVHLSLKIDNSWRVWIVALVLIATLVNVFLVWLAHMTSTENLQTMREQNVEDDTMELAWKKVSELRERNAAEIAERISQQIVGNAHGNLLARHAKSSPAIASTPLATAPVLTTPAKN